MKEEKIHKELVNLIDFKEFDVDQEWNSFLDKAKTIQPALQGNKLEDNVKSAPVRRLPRLGLSVAASLILLIGCMYFFNLKPETDIDPILAEQQVPAEVIPQVQITDTEPAVTEPEIVEYVTPKEKVVPKEKLTPKETVTLAEQIIIENKPFVVADIPMPEAPAPEYERYEIGEILNLEDGSTIEILDVAIMKIPETFKGASSRNIKIKRGNSEFTVTKNESQPFSVTTTNSEVSVLGTTFRVLSEGIETTVGTIEGLVEFYAIADPEQKVQISAGEEYKFDGSAMEQLSGQVETPEAEMTQTSLEGLKNLFEQNFSGKVNVKGNAVKSSEISQLVDIPENFEEFEDFLKVIELLEEHVTIKYKERRCDSCYTIESIRVKDNK